MDKSVNREIKFRAWDDSKKEMMLNPIIQYFSSKGEISIFTGRDITLMQFTGLKDKNGKEIYEGDILEGEDFCGKHRGKMIFADGVMDTENGMNQNMGIENCEVIGNIHENPDLLEVGGKELVK